MAFLFLNLRLNSGKMARKKSSEPMKTTNSALLVNTLLIGLFAAPVTSVAQTAVPIPSGSAAATYALRPVWKTGETARYKMTVHRTADKKRYDLDIVDSLFHITMLQTIRDVKPDGTVIMEDTTEEADGDFDGRDMELTSAIPKMTLTRDKTGEAAVKSEGGVALLRETMEQLFRLTTRMQRGFTPPAPVRVGESWKFNWQDTGLVVGNTEGKGILVGPGTWNGQPTWRVKVEYDAKVNATDPRTGNKADVVFHFTGVADMDTKNFQILQLTGNGMEHLDDNATAKTEVTLTRLPAKGEDREKRRQGDKEKQTAKDAK